MARGWKVRRECLLRVRDVCYVRQSTERKRRLEYTIALAKRDEAAHHRLSYQMCSSVAVGVRWRCFQHSTGNTDRRRRIRERICIEMCRVAVGYRLSTRDGRTPRRDIVAERESIDIAGFARRSPRCLESVSRPKQLAYSKCHSSRTMDAE